MLLLASWPGDHDKPLTPGASIRLDLFLLVLLLYLRTTLWYHLIEALHSLYQGLFTKRYIEQKGQRSAMKTLIKGACGSCYHFFSSGQTGANMAPGPHMSDCPAHLLAPLLPLTVVCAQPVDCLMLGTSLVTKLKLTLLAISVQSICYPLRKPCFPVDCRSMVKWRIANISSKNRIFLKAFRCFVALVFFNYGFGANQPTLHGGGSLTGERSVAVAVVLCDMCQVAAGDT